jgi:hypothetical protein
MSDTQNTPSTTNAPNISNATNTPDTSTHESQLTYSLLETLDQSSDFLQLIDVEVKRLRDDRGEIQLGQDLALVATATFQIAKRPDSPKPSPLKHVSRGDALLVIGSDAELRSDRVALDLDGVTRWIHDHYDFTFLLNGSPSSLFSAVGQVRVREEPDEGAVIALPWLRKLSTSELRTDYINVDVRIDHKPREVKADPPEPIPMPARQAIDRARLTLELAGDDLTVKPLEDDDGATGFQILSDGSELLTLSFVPVGASGSSRSTRGSKASK